MKRVAAGAHLQIVAWMTEISSDMMCDGKILLCVSDAPDPPSGLEIEKFDRYSCALKWKEPLSDGGNPIKGNWERFHFRVRNDFFLI